MSRIHITTILLIAVIMWAAALLVGGIILTPGFARPFSLVTGAVVGAITVFDLWLWRLRWLQGWFVKRPVLRGTWRAVLDSSWKEPGTEETLPAFRGAMVIRQTYSSLSMRLLTGESSSQLLGGEIKRHVDGTYVLVGVYENNPKLKYRNRSPIHYGAVVLSVEGTRPSRITGHYWTDRDTGGHIVLTDPTDKLAFSLAEAETLLAPSEPPSPNARKADA